MSLGRRFREDEKQLKNKNSWQSKMGVLITKAGVLPMPLSLLRFKRQLKLTPWAMVFIGLIYMFKQEGKWPYLNLSKATREYGFCFDTLNKIIKRLKTETFLETRPLGGNPKGKSINIYDLSGLEKKLDNLIIDNREKIFKTENWTLEDDLDVVFPDDADRNDTPEKQSIYPTKNREHNKE